MKDRKTILPPSGLMEKIFNSCFSNYDPKSRLASFQANFATLRRKYFPKLGIIDAEIENFLTGGGFPFCLLYREVEIYNEILKICRKVTSDDLPLFPGVGGTKSIRKGIPCLQLVADSPETSTQKISKSVRNISSEQVRNIFKGYEKAGIIYTVKPYGTAGQIIRKSKKYYLASPTLQASLLYSLGNFEVNSESLGKLLETYTADILRRKSETKEETIDDFFYDHQKGGADFIVKLRNGRKIVIEVGWGSKDPSQVLNTLGRIKGDYGLIVGGEGEKHKVCTKNGTNYDVFYIPKEAFIMV